jgi:hypothetical protein
MGSLGEPSHAAARVVVRCGFRRRVEVCGTGMMSGRSQRDWSDPGSADT